MASEPSGLTLDVVQRLQTIQVIELSLSDEGDEDEMALNVTAIMQAYRSGQLEWNPGLVTYWSKGVQLYERRVFDWKEFYIINQKHNGQKGFWVEGVSD